MSWKRSGAFFLFLAGIGAWAQAAEWRLCVLVDGSEKMVIEKAYDAVLSALDTQILDARKQQATTEEWTVEIIAAGITKQMWGSQRYFGTLPLYPSGVGLDGTKKNNRIPNITDESPVTFAELKSEFHKFVSEKAQLNAGVIIISDQSEVNQLSDKSKYHRNILVELVKSRDEVVPTPNRLKISTDVKAAFDSYFAYVNDQVKQPAVSVECLDKSPFFEGTPVRLKVKGMCLGYAVVDFGDGTPVLRIEQAEVDRQVEHTFKGKGKFSVEVKGVKGTKEAAAKVDVLVEERPFVPPPVQQPTVKIMTPEDGPLFAGNPVNIRLDVKGAKETKISFGDGSPTVDYSSEMATKGVDHVYAREGDFTVEVSALGAGGSAKRQSVISIMPLPKIELGIEPAGRSDGKVVATPRAAQATSIQLDFGDGAVLPATDGQALTHAYAKDGTYAIRMTATRQEKEEKVEKTVTVKQPLVVLTAPDLSVEVSGDSVVAIPKADQATSIQLDFGEGGAAVPAKDRQPANHTYATAGSYTVKMTVSRQGKTEVVEKTVEVTKAPPSAPAPVAAFALETSSGEIHAQENGGYAVKRGETVDFVNKSKNAQRFRWVFGDDSGAVTERSAAHAYSVSGQYEVTLTAYGEGNQSAASKVTVSVAEGFAGGLILGALAFLLLVAAALGFLLWSKRPELSVVVSINGQPGNLKAFNWFSHRVALSELSDPLECRARKVDDLWQVEFRALDDRVLERLPSQTPIRLEARVWSQPMNPGEFVVAGKPNEVIKVMGEE